MSDNIPFEIQMEIIKKVSNVNSLIQFRSVSKPWKSFIDSSDFIKGYGARHTQPHSHILSYISDYTDDEVKYSCLVDDDIETFKVQQEDFSPFVVSHLLKQCRITSVIGASHGLLCLFGYYKDKNILVIWNHSIGKSFGIALPRCGLPTGYGFGICPDTSDPTVVKFVCADRMPWHVEVFKLSLGVWNVIPSGNLPFQSQNIRFEMSSHVVIDNFIYWCARERTNIDYVENHLVVSFDLITEEFKVVNLPDTLKKVSLTISVFKLRGSLVVCGNTMADQASVWVMENDSSFRNLFTIGAPIYIDKILGFKKTGEIIFTTPDGPKILGAKFLTEVLHVYDLSLQQIKNLGISGIYYSFFMDSYSESLLLLDHLDSHIYDKFIEKHVLETTPPSPPRLGGGIVNSSHLSEITPHSTPITLPFTPRLGGGIVNSSRISEITPHSTLITPHSTPRLGGGIVNSSHIPEITPPSTPITPPSTPRLGGGIVNSSHIPEITPPSTPITPPSTLRLGGGVVNSSHISEITPPSTPSTPPCAPRLYWICQTTPDAPMEKTSPTPEDHVTAFTLTLVPRLPIHQCSAQEDLTYEERTETYF